MRLPFTWALPCLGVLGVGPVGGAAMGCGPVKATASDAGPSSDDEGPVASDADAPIDAPAEASATAPQGYPASHPAPPTVVSLGGPVVSAPKFIPVTFPGEALLTQVQDFMSKVGPSAYWTGNVAEYGVGAATMGKSVEFPSNPFPTSPVDDAGRPTVDDTAIGAWVTQEVANGGLPPYDDNTIYVLFMPANLDITLGGETSCQEFGGYHSETYLTTTAAPYAVIPRCSGSFGGLSGIDMVTGAASHELIEAATDPFPSTMPAYAQVDNKDLGWLIAFGGSEVADMCAQSENAFFQSASLGYTVQRTWSNKAGAASQDPCIPSQGGTYFNTASVLPNTVMLNDGSLITASSVNIPLGQTKTIDLDLFSDKATTEWFVSVEDGAYLQGLSPQLDLKLSKTSGNNGDKLELTITPLVAGQGNLETFVIASGATQNNLWVGLVSSQ